MVLLNGLLLMAVAELEYDKTQSVQVIQLICSYSCRVLLGSVYVLLREALRLHDNSAHECA